MLSFIPLFAPLAEAQIARDDELAPTKYFSLLGGLAVPTCSLECDPRGSWGADFGIKLSPELDIGIQFTTSTQSVGPLSISHGFLVGQANYYLVPDQLYVGARAGATFQKFLVEFLQAMGSDSETDFSFGAQAGATFKVNPNFSYGFELNWNYVPDSLVWGSYSVFHFVVPIRLWF